MKTLIIAEPGGTHGGNLDVMIRLVDTAADCGAGCYKSQWVSSAQTMCDRRHAPEYLDSYRLLEYPLEWHRVLSLAAHERGMEYACTAYLPGDPTKLAPFVDYLKIASFERADESMLVEATGFGIPVIVSTGMSNEGDLCGKGSVWDWQDDDQPWGQRKFVVLGCTSSYPTPLDSLCLRDLRMDGYSDHSHDVRVGAWAVAAGASILETHFRLADCDPSNKDYAVAFTPAEFAEYVRNVRDCEAALGDGVKRIMDAEQPMLRYRVTA